jgi:ATP-binding cassette subfamily B protein
MHPVSDPTRATARDLLRKSLPFISPYRARLAVVLATALLGAAVGACEPLALKSIFDGLGASTRSLHGLLAGTALLAGVLAVRGALGVRLDRASWRVRIAIHERLTRAVVSRLHALPIAYHRGSSPAAVMTRMERGINGSVAAFSDVFFQMVPTALYLALSLAIMVQLDWRVTVAVCLFVPVPPLLSAWAAGEQAQRERTLLDRWAALFARLNEILSSIALVKSSTMEEAEAGRFLSGVEKANGVVVRGVVTDSRVGVMKGLAVGLARLAALVLGGLRVARGELSPGALVAFLGYIGALFGPVQGLAAMVQTVRRGAVSLEAVFSILDAPETIADSPDALQMERLRGEVELRKVTFEYRPGNPVFRDLDLKVAPGERVALVGPSGSGKTTLMSLLQRFYDPTRGQVLVDGVDVRRIAQRSLRTHIGVVSQEVPLLDDTIRDNIAFGRPGATFDEIVSAARDAHAHEFIVDLPDGYDTRVGDRGALLSAGQRQRIAIARALLRDPAILILDEATSALDAESEAIVQDAMDRLSTGRTTFVVAHRLATVTRADRILVFRSGQIIESGTHGDLVGRRGYYASLVERQVRGLLVEAA